MSQSAALNLHLHPKQGEAFNTIANEVLYGGAAGGGKSFLMRVAAIIWCASIPGLQVYLFRRIREDLVKNHMEGPKGFRALLAVWVNAGLCQIVEDEIRFWNGAKIYLCHCKDEKDIYKYQGAEIHVLLIDELTHFLEAMYRFLRNRVRMVGITLPEQYAGRFPRILCGANPGGVGHLWVKRTFVEGVLPMQLRPMSESEGGMLRQYIKAKLEDNPSMAKDDPGYEGRLQGLGSESLVRAMRHGDWDIIEGAFFDCWDASRHVLRPFEIPAHWTRTRSGDWGSAAPFSFGWWAVVSDAFKTPSGVWLPRGALVRYREWYGCKRDENGAAVPNVGVKLPAYKVGEELLRIEEAMGNRPADGVLDPAAFAENGGPSIAEEIAAGAKGKVYFRPADNKRVAQRGAMGGWDQMRNRLLGDADGNPMIATFETCTDSIRTIPALQHDKNRPEDLDTDMEDHAADDWRYMCLSRPWISPATKPSEPRDKYPLRGARGGGWKTA
ncbi:MAG: terminase family protein [Hyphomonadaceae bacterium]